MTVSPAQAQASKESFNILLVDDDDTDRHFYSELLRSNTDYNCTQSIASSLKEARTVLAANDNIDCVLLDYRLRDGTSDMLVEEIKTSDASPAIIIFTGFADQQKALDLLRLGAHDYLDKRLINREMLSRCVRYGIARAKGEKLQTKLKTEQELNQLQSDFISIISHEFKNPIHVIGQSVSVIKRKIAGPLLQTINDYLSGISASAAQMNQLLDQTAEFAAFDANNMDINLHPTNIQTLLLRDMERFKMLYPERNFLLAGHAQDMPKIMVDDVLYRQVIDNVIGNAVKYSDEGTKINTLMVVADDYIHVRIQDYGRGIPKADLEKIGHKFFRATNVEGVSGTGMGLYLVKALMQLMGGTYQIESREDVGTVVTLGFQRV